jgi:hypothetical protein
MTLFQTALMLSCVDISRPVPNVADQFVREKLKLFKKQK